MNSHTIMGRLGKDPEIRSFQDGGRVCNFSVATSETWKDKSTGERRERTQWHNIAIFNDGLVGVCEKYLRKGSRVALTGQVETRKWQDQSGLDRWTTETVIRPFRGDLHVIDWPDKNDQQSAEPQSSDTTKDNGGTSAGNVMEDEIPFLYEWRG